MVTGLPGNITSENDVQVSFAINHRFVGDIRIGIIPPGGSETTIINEISGGNYNGSNVLVISQSASGTIPNNGSTRSIPAGTYLPTGDKPVGNLGSLVGASRNGTWRIRVYDLYLGDVGTLQSASITFLAPCTPPTVSISPASQSVTSGGSVTLTALGATSYAWSNGQTTPSITVNNVTADATFSVTGTTGACPASATGTVTVLCSPAAITSGPAAQSVVCQGTTVAITVNFTGDVNRYQLYKGSSSTPVLSQTTATQTSVTFSLTNVQPADAGSYSVVLASACGSATSTAFSLTVNPSAGFITQPPAGQAQCVGGTVTATVSASGTPSSTGSFAYQWYKNSLASPVTSQTTATLSLTNVQTADAGSYSVVVTGSCNGATSKAFSLTVNRAVAITAQPAAGALVCVGSTLTASISTTGDVTSYQWYKNNLATPVAGQTTATLTIASPIATDAGSYSVVITSGGCNTLTSTGFSLTVNTPVAITTQPAAQSVVCEGIPVSVSISTTGTTTRYQWYKNNLATPVAGQTTARLTLSSPTVADAGSYSVVVTSGSCNTLTSAAFSLTVNPSPGVVLTFPNSATVQGAAGPTILIPASALGQNLLATGGAVYDWYVVMDRINGYEIRETTSNTTGLIRITRAGFYRITVTEALGCTRTVEGVIVVRP